MFLKLDDVMVELTYIGEGISGEYDPQDINDVPLLRFTVLKRAKNYRDGWIQLDGASYCTNIPESTNIVQQAMILGQIMDCVYDRVNNNRSIAGICEALSHIDEEGLQ